MAHIQDLTIHVWGNVSAGWKTAHGGLQLSSDRLGTTHVDLRFHPVASPDLTTCYHHGRILLADLFWNLLIDTFWHMFEVLFQTVSPFAKTGCSLYWDWKNKTHPFPWLAVSSRCGCHVHLIVPGIVPICHCGVWMTGRHCWLERHGILHQVEHPLHGVLQIQHSGLECVDLLLLFGWWFPS